MTRQVSPPGPMPALNESPSEKEGKYNPGVHIHLTQIPQ